MFQVLRFKSRLHRGPSTLSSEFYEKGITLVEIIVVIFIITMFSVILISSFPKILRQFALSRATYRFAQDLRKAQDLGLSGVQITNSQGNLIVAKGYGVYINLIDDNKKYIIYADRGGGDNKYNDGGLLCQDTDQQSADCILETVYVSNENPDLFIEKLENTNSAFTSINFTPPNPTTTIDNLSQGNSEIGIVLGLKSDSFFKTVWVNASGLIQTK